MAILKKLEEIEDSLKVAKNLKDLDKCSKNLSALDQSINEVNASYYYRLKGLCEYFSGQINKSVESFEEYFSKLTNITSEENRFEIQQCLYICLKVSIIKRDWFSLYSYFFTLLECFVNENKNYVRDWSLPNYSNIDKIKYILQRAPIYFPNESSNISRAVNFDFVLDIFKDSDSFNELIKVLCQGLEEIFEKNGKINPNKCIETVNNAFLLVKKKIEISYPISGLIVIEVIKTISGGHKNQGTFLNLKDQTEKLSAIIMKKENNIITLNEHFAEAYLIFDYRDFSKLYEPKGIDKLNLFVFNKKFSLAIKYFSEIDSSKFKDYSDEVKAKFYFQIGYCYYRKQRVKWSYEENKIFNYTKALEYYNRAFNLQKDPLNINKIERKMGKIYRLLGHITKAINIYEKTGKISESNNIQFFRIFQLINKGLTHKKVYSEKIFLEIENDETLKKKFYSKKLYLEKEKKSKMYESFIKFYKVPNPPNQNKFFWDKFLSEYKFCEKFSKLKSHFLEVHGYYHKEFTIIMDKGEKLPDNYFKKLGNEKIILREIMWLIEGYQHMVRKKIIHGDIKPDNILLGSDKKLKIIDFGSSKKVKLLGASHYSPFCGDKSYLSPELYLYSKFEYPSIYFDPLKSDVFSLGLTILDLLGEKIGVSASLSEPGSIPEASIKSFVLNGFDVKNCEDISKLMKPLDQKIKFIISQLVNYKKIKELLVRMLNVNYNQRWNYHQIQSYLIDFV